MSDEAAIKLQDVRVVAGRIIPVYNKFKKPTAAAMYYSIWVEDADGKNERCIFLTEAMLKTAEEIALKNPEDIPKKCWLADLLD